MTRRLVAVGAALVIALVGVLLLFAYARKADARAVAGQEVSSVYIAKSMVPEGTSAKDAVDKGLLVKQQVVAKGVPQGAMTSLDPATDNLVAQNDIAVGQMVLTSVFGAPKKPATVAALVPAKMVAISVSLADPAGVAPLITVGSHIAIFDSFNSRDPKATPLAPYGAHLNDDKGTLRGTGVVLPDVQVIVVGATATPPAGSSSPSPSPSSSTTSQQATDNGQITLTVAIKPEDATRLVHAIQTGNVYVGLLGVGATVDPKSTANDNTVVKH